MALKIFSSNLDRIYFDNVELNRIYYNNTLVWEKAVTPPTPDVPSVEYEDCWECNGNGGFECTACDKGECIVCGGSGYTASKTCQFCTEGECWNCHASGRIPVGCDVCYASGFEPCGKCNRRGYYYGCNACGTEMYYSGGTWHCSRCGADRPYAVEIRCTYCGGNGHFGYDCANCGGTGSVYERCPICNGIGGPCTYCNGQHYISSGKCSNCGGTGYCPLCDMGVITCDRCNGTGQLEAFKTTYDASSGSVTFTLRNGEQLWAELTDQSPDSWVFSANFPLEVLTYNDISAPQHWGNYEVTPSYIGGSSKVLIFEFDRYISHDGNDFWDFVGDGYLEGEFITHFGERVATLVYDETARIWSIT